MRKIISIFSVGLGLVFLINCSALAGGRYHFHHRYHSHHRHVNGGHFWAHLGAGLLTGVILGTVFSQTVPERRVVYTTQPVYTPPPPPPVYPAPERINNYTYSPAETKTELVLRRVATTPQLLNLRAGPGLDTAISGQLNEGTVVDVIGAAPGWIYVRTDTGLYGWVMTEFTQDLTHPVG